MNTSTLDHGELLREQVRSRYGTIAGKSSCGCGTSCCGTAATTGFEDPISSNLYAPGEAAQVPVEALAAALGCGNPTALAALAEGETVLDLGSGGGIDVLCRHGASDPLARPSVST
jgi:arsenite methyltransferase